VDSVIGSYNLVDAVGLAFAEDLFWTIPFVQPSGSIPSTLYTLDPVDASPTAIFSLPNIAGVQGLTAGPRFSDVPTPATLALFSIGLAGLGWARRKKC